MIMWLLRNPLGNTGWNIHTYKVRVVNSCSVYDSEDACACTEYTLQCLHSSTVHVHVQGVLCLNNYMDMDMYCTCKSDLSIPKFVTF